MEERQEEYLIMEKRLENPGGLTQFTARKGIRWAEFLHAKDPFFPFSVDILDWYLALVLNNASLYFFTVFERN